MSDERKRGRPPGQTPPRTNLHIELPEKLLAALDYEAGEQEMSRNALIITAIRHYLMDRHDTLAQHDAWVTEQTGERPPLDAERLRFWRAAGLVK
jgi:hypothetical protein